MKTVKEFLNERKEFSEKDIAELTRLLAEKGVNVSSNIKGKSSTITLSFTSKDFKKSRLEDSEGKTYKITIEEVSEI